MKFSTVIVIAVIAVVASLAMVDATPVLDRRAPQSSNEEFNEEFF
jgi:Tfp pilus assembly protein FimT